MRIINRDGEKHLLELLAGGNVSQFYRVLNQPFRFSAREQDYWRDFARLETHIYLSEEGIYIPQAIGLVGYALRTFGSEIAIAEASRVLQKAAWHDGLHLETLVGYAEKILAGGYSLISRENAADAIKNAAYYPGNHIAPVVAIALRYGLASTPSIRSACVRAISEAANHSPDRLATDEVRQFLELKMKDSNSFNRENAQQALEKIGSFEKSL